MTSPMFFVAFRRIAFLSLVIISVCASGWGSTFAHQDEPSPTPEVAGIPVGVEMRYATFIEVESGDYQWRLVRSTTSLPGDAPIAVQRGVLIASTGSVLVSHQDARLDLVESGTGLLLEEGEAILPVSVGTASEDVMFAELLPVPVPAEGSPTETPDSAAPATIPAGTYVVALFHIPASADAETFADDVMASAISPALVIADPAPAIPVPLDAEGARWIVALFAPTVPGANQGSESTTNGNPPARTTSTATPTTTNTPNATATATSAATMTPSTTATMMPTATATMEPTLPPIIAENPSPTPGGLGSKDDPVQIENGALSIIELTRDTDADGLVDALEKEAGSDPNDKDSDDDGLEDGPEVDNNCSPLKADTDADGVTDDGEVLLFGTKCNDLDTDNDSLSDYDEIFVYYSDPLLWDTDGDTLSDYDEVITFNTGPRAADSDGDGWRDDYEISVTGTNPLLRDGDFDCVMDSTEANYGTNSFAGDTDGDGQWDGQELTDGTIPNNSEHYVIDPEDWEEKYGRTFVVGCDGTYIVW